MIAYQTFPTKAIKSSKFCGAITKADALPTSLKPWMTVIQSISNGE
jgi:hypothetical protein